jgi:hypothetical protein
MINHGLRVLAVSLCAEEIEVARLRFDDERALGGIGAVTGFAAFGDNPFCAPIQEVVGSSRVVGSFVLRMGGVVAVPFRAGAQHHRIATVAILVGWADEIELGLPLGILMARKCFAVGAGSETDVGPIAVEHPKPVIVTHYEGCLQTALRLTESGVGMERDSFRCPVHVGELRAFPAMKQARLSGLLRSPDAGPKLPCAIGGLPDAEVDWLLLRRCEWPQVGIACDNPPIADEPRHQGLRSGVKGHPDQRGARPNSKEACHSMWGKKMVRLAGLEPARVTPLPPQSSVSANSTISANGPLNESAPVRWSKSILLKTALLRELPEEFSPHKTARSMHGRQRFERPV